MMSPLSPIPNAKKTLDHLYVYTKSGLIGKLELMYMKYL